MGTMRPNKYDVIAGAKCTTLDVQLQSACSNKFVRIESDGRVLANDNSDLPQNITISTDEIIWKNTASSENFRLRLTLYAKQAQMHLCFNKRWRLVGMKKIRGEMCHFYETMVNGYIQYRSVLDETKFIGFTKNGRPIKFLPPPSDGQDENCFKFFKWNQTNSSGINNIEATSSTNNHHIRHQNHHQQQQQQQQQHNQQQQTQGAKKKQQQQQQSNIKLTKDRVNEKGVINVGGKIPLKSNRQQAGGQVNKNTRLANQQRKLQKEQQQRQEMSRYQPEDDYRNDDNVIRGNQPTSTTYLSSTEYIFARKSPVKKVTTNNSGVAPKMRHNHHGKHGQQTKRKGQQINRSYE